MHKANAEPAITRAADRSGKDQGIVIARGSGGSRLLPPTGDTGLSRKCKPLAPTRRPKAADFKEIAPFERPTARSGRPPGVDRWIDSRGRFSGR
jgi:hypothetical protein